MKRNRLKHPKKLRIPDFEDDKEELLRLMRRIRPVEEDTDGCHVCGDAHFCEDCPCFDMIPRADLELGPEYDKVCIGCGRIGEICHPKGAYAVRKRCGGCGDYGHWYWENSCDEDWRKPDFIAEIPSIEELEEEVMNKKDNAVVEEDEESDVEGDDDCDVFLDDQGRRKKIKSPDFLLDKEEILRLMKRIPPSPPAEKKGMLDCPVCGDDHFHEDCPCFDRIPGDVVLRPEYDMICRGCGKIGEICCSKGAYAKLKRCGGCCRTGHWYWENKCSKDWHRPSHTVKIPSIKKLEEEVMKNKYKVPAEEDEEDDDEAKRGNEFLKQSSIGRKKHKSRSKSKRKILRQSSIGQEKLEALSKSQKKILRRSSIGPEKFEAMSRSKKMVWDILLRPEVDAQTQAAQQVRMPDMSPVMAKLEISGAGASPADEVEAKIDETGIEPVYIDCDMTQGSKAGKGFQDSQ